MRLWSLHPKYLDSKGLTALWREGLLAQKVLAGKTRGYKNHPQLDRFKACRNPRKAIAAYLGGVWREADARGFEFDGKKIDLTAKHPRLKVTLGQMRYEFEWLQQKLKKRDPARRKENQSLRSVKPHPMFKACPGAVESWEKR